METYGMISEKSVKCVSVKDYNEDKIRRRNNKQKFIRFLKENDTLYDFYSRVQ